MNVQFWSSPKFDFANHGIIGTTPVELAFVDGQFVNRRNAEV